jgi:hypothetical protein
VCLLAQKLESLLSKIVKLMLVIANLLLLDVFVNVLMMPSFKDPMQLLYVSSSFNGTELCVSRFG